MLPSLNKPKGMIFDWDGTLTSTEQLFLTSFYKTLEYMGCKDPKSYAIPSISSRDYFQQQFGGRYLEAEKYYYNLITQNHLVEMSVIEGVPQLLETIKKMDIPLFILSNKRGPVLRKEIKHLNWGEYFENVVGSTDAPADKPSLDAVLHTLEDSFITLGEDVWFVGDTIVDMECAHISKCLPVLIENPARPVSSLEKFPPAIKVSSPLDLQNLIYSIR